MRGTGSGWRSRYYLPHFEAGRWPQTVTFRLADSLPRETLLAWDADLRGLPPMRADAERRRLVEEYLDQGHGAAWLADHRIAAVVESALLHFDGERYRLHAWVVMPNHVHALLTPVAGLPLGGIVHSWKSFTANRANRLLGRRGHFWQDDYFDRFVRDERHFAAAQAYIEGNPVKAGLCCIPDAWPFSSAHRRIAVHGEAGP